MPSKAAKAAKANDKKPRKYSGNCKRWKLSQELEKITGVKVGTRNGIVKQLWTYIKANNLQDPQDKRYFYPDRTMLPVFGNGRVRCFAMSKYLVKHLTLLQVQPTKDVEAANAEDRARFAVE